MNDEEDVSGHSDSSDEDYVPEKQKQEQIPSEEDTDDPLSDDQQETGGKRRKFTKGNKNKTRKKQKGESAVEEDLEKSEEPTGLTAEEKKKKDDDLWADFMKDTGFQGKNSQAQTSSASTTTSSPKTIKPAVPKSEEKKAPEKVKVTKIFEFAGEEVEVEEEVPINSLEARLLNTPGSASKGGERRGGGLTGISLLNMLDKKQKISTLEKSKLDWNKFKKDENLEEELQTYNRGKDGYLEKQEFLERTDFRTFEVEREIRARERSKRLNNTL